MLFVGLGVEGGSGRGARLGSAGGVDLTIVNGTLTVMLLYRGTYGVAATFEGYTRVDLEGVELGYAQQCKAVRINALT